MPTKTKNQIITSTAVQKEETISAMNIVRIAQATVDIPVTGITPLIVHQFSEKAKKQMLDSDTTKVRGKKPPRNPEESYKQSRYILDAALQKESGAEDGFPAVGFKAAIVGAARLFDASVTMTALRSALYVQGYGSQQLVPVMGEHEMREDVVRVGQGVADLRYRAMYPEWSALLTVKYIPTQISLEGVFALVEAAGMGGIGEWRPSSPKSNTGSYGQFTIDMGILEAAV